jgi:hypothetical protein
LALAERVGSTGADVVGPRIDYARGQLIADVSLEADLPGAGIPKSSELRFRERWTRPYQDQSWRLHEYFYELVDHERDARRALHLHDSEWFVEKFRVVVHEHCESPIGTAPCDHYVGLPIKDGHDAIDRLMGIWTRDDGPDCSELVCLDQNR